MPVRNTLRASVSHMLKSAGSMTLRPQYSQSLPVSYRSFFCQPTKLGRLSSASSTCMSSQDVEQSENGRGITQLDRDYMNLALDLARKGQVLNKRSFHSTLHIAEPRYDTPLPLCLAAS